MDKKQIEEWKDEFGKIYQTFVYNKPVVYRQLTREDYMNITNLVGTGEVRDPERETVNTCVLSGLDNDILDAKDGLTNSIYELIMRDSGFLMLESQEL